MVERGGVGDQARDVTPGTKEERFLAGALLEADDAGAELRRVPRLLLARQLKEAPRIRSQTEVPLLETERALKLAERMGEDPRPAVDRVDAVDEKVEVRVLLVAMGDHHRLVGAQAEVGQCSPADADKDAPGQPAALRIPRVEAHDDVQDRLLYAPVHARRKGHHGDGRLDSGGPYVDSLGPLDATCLFAIVAMFEVPGDVRKAPAEPQLTEHLRIPGRPSRTDGARRGPPFQRWRAGGSLRKAVFQSR